jgi:uncharacterized protein
MQANAPAVAAPPPFGEPTPLGLLGLSIGCAALLPIAFNQIPADPLKAAMMLKTAAWFCLLFGAGGQFLAGIMSLANKNTLGGTLFTTFSFNWVYNWWVLDSLSAGKVPDPTVGLWVDICFIVIFVVLTFAFGFFSKLLFAFLLDIDLLYVFRIGRHFTTPGSGGWDAMSLGIGVSTIALISIALYIAFALLVNPAAGRPVFPFPGPLFLPKPPPVAEVPRAAA